MEIFSAIMWGKGPESKPHSLRGRHGESGESEGDGTLLSSSHSYAAGSGVPQCSWVRLQSLGASYGDSASLGSHPVLSSVSGACCFTGVWEDGLLCSVFPGPRVLAAREVPRASTWMTTTSHGHPSFPKRFQ